jgi:hypothetical protein
MDARLLAQAKGFGKKNGLPSGSPPEKGNASAAARIIGAETFQLLYQGGRGHGFAFARRPGVGIMAVTCSADAALQKTTARMPGPSTRPRLSKEWILPSMARSLLSRVGGKKADDPGFFAQTVGFATIILHVVYPRSVSHMIRSYSIRSWRMLSRGEIRGGRR